MNNQQRIHICNEALEANKCFLSQTEICEIHDLINRHNEWGVGIEMLIDIICENENKIEIDQYNKIHKAMVSMGLGDSDRIHQLRGQV